ncbi:hypothetical protein TRVL_04786 [Trypanosoma vivax]|nr:hypothetical protein TRVL_04786 [Trypanosoma vivax]
MPKQQLTHDAAYKYALWQSLFCKAQDRQKREIRRVNHDTFVRNVGFSLVKAILPQRTPRSCCISGMCGRDSMMRKGVRFGRPEVEILNKGRDDVLQCLSHSTACLGGPVDLRVRGYCSVPLLTDDGFAGLRCLLRHTRLKSVIFSDVLALPDAQQVVNEISNAMACEQNKIEYLSLENLPRHVNLGSVFVSAAAANTLMELRLENCGLHDVAALGRCVTILKGLRRLSLRGNEGISKQITLLADIIGSCEQLQTLDIAFCQLEDEHIEQFLAHTETFTCREKFALNVSNNDLSGHSLACFRYAPLAFCNALSELDISGHDFACAGMGIEAMLLSCDALHGIALDQCNIGVRDMQKICRALGRMGRRWNLLSFCENNLAMTEVKRLVPSSFAMGSRLCLSGNKIGVGLHGLNVAGMIALLGELDLRSCNVREEGLLQLASAIEKAGCVPLRVLRLDNNGVWSRGAWDKGGLQFLGRALRARRAPCLEVLSLSKNELLLRPLLTLLEQVSCTLRELHVSHSPITDDMSDLLGCLIRRQGGSNAFRHIDIWALSRADDVSFTGESQKWLEGQRAVRIITEVK